MGREIYDDQVEDGSCTGICIVDAKGGQNKTLNDENA